MNQEEEEEEEKAPEVKDSPERLVVPKLRLTLPKNFKPVESEESSTESDDENVVEELPEEEEVAPPPPPVVEESPEEAPIEKPISPVGFEYDEIEVADENTQLHDLQLDEPLDKIDLTELLRKCLQKTVDFCLYCYHARRIAVNGKGLALHFIGCHRFQATVNSITAEELTTEAFVAKFKGSLDELEKFYLNSDKYCSIGNTVGEIQYERERFYECIQCRYTTSTHKELYVHNRKLHLGSILMCLMCRIPFYSFCELICHMCPGVCGKCTMLDLEFRCCLCNLDHIPSAFRLMIHLRRHHFACDVCVEVCHDTVRLSSHVWKHKLLHVCHRCGKAYRNKVDIQNHLFWRHNTESVQCKRCLQKKWPHVYHFCMPAAAFPCEVCGLEFTRAVSLRVHERIHSGNTKYPCIEEGCEKRFISKKLLLKHVARHNEPPPLPVPEPIEESPMAEEAKVAGAPDVPEKKKSKKRRKKDDIMDLINFSGPNLSESGSSDESDDGEKTASPRTDTRLSSSALDEQDAETAPKTDDQPQPGPSQEDDQQPAADIWENFKHFQESQGRFSFFSVKNP